MWRWTFTLHLVTSDTQHHFQVGKTKKLSKATELSFSPSEGTKMYPEKTLNNDSFKKAKSKVSLSERGTNVREGLTAVLQQTSIQASEKWKINKRLMLYSLSVAVRLDQSKSRYHRRPGENVLVRLTLCSTWLSVTLGAESPASRWPSCMTAKSKWVHWVKLFLMATLGKRSESSCTTRMSTCEQKETSRRLSCGHDWRSFFSEAALTSRVPADQRGGRGRGKEALLWA